MSEEKNSEIENTTPTFELAEGKISFFVSIPNNLTGSWIKKLGGSYNQGKKMYVFLMKYLSNVEEHLGLKSGDSGLKDPKYYFNVTFEGHFHDEKGFNSLKKAVEAQGFKWNKKNSRFEGPVTSYDSVKEKLSK